MSDAHTLDVSASATIAAPPEVVFAIVSDARQHSRIDGGGTVRDASVDAPEKLTLGSEFGMSMKMGASYSMKNRVVEYDDDRLIAWRHVGAHRWRYALEPVEVDGRPGTRVTETWDLSAYPGFYRKGLSLLFGRKTQRAVEGTVAKLKAAAEEDASA